MAVKAFCGHHSIMESVAATPSKRTILSWLFQLAVVAAILAGGTSANSGPRHTWLPAHTYAAIALQGPADTVPTVTLNAVNRLRAAGSPFVIGLFGATAIAAYGAVLFARAMNADPAAR